MSTNEIIAISPESLEILQIYLSTQSINETARILDVHPTQISQYLRKAEVKRYLDHVYLESGYRNRDKIASTMDDIISMKLEEMVETQLGSTKDIADLLQMAHKMRMDELKAMADYEKAKEGTVKKQTNVQINNASPYGETRYGDLLGKLLG